MTIQTKPAVEITLNFVFGGDVSSMQAQLTTVCDMIANLLGCVKPQCSVTCTVTAGSVNVEAIAIDTAPVSSVQTAAQALPSKSTSELSASLGVTVEAAPTVSAPVSVTVQAIVPGPSPPPPPPPSPPPICNECQVFHVGVSSHAACLRVQGGVGHCYMPEGGYGGACPYDTTPCPSGSASAFVPPQAASCVDRKKKKCNKFVRKQKTAKKCLKNKWKKKCKKTCNAC